MENIKTQRLTITLADKNDLPLLDEINNECEEYFAFDPQSELNHNCSIEECLTAGDIPTGVDKESYKKENYFFFCIWQNDILIGFLSYYLAYQQTDTVYLSVLYIKESHRKNGIGTEILKVLIEQFLANQFKTIRLHCSLRNSIGLRFWVKNGFNHIINVECNGNLFPGNFGGIGLTYSITSRAPLKEAMLVRISRTSSKVQGER